MENNINTRIKANYIQFKHLLFSFLPNGKEEVFLFLVFLLFYFSFSLFIILNTSIIDNQSMMFDVYFSFDNPLFFKQGYLYMEAHPLLRWMSYPYVLVGNLLLVLLGLKAKTVLAVLLCNIAVTLSMIYIYRYLKKVVEIDGFMLYILTFFYGFFSTNLILCFTPESFTMSIFFLTFTLFYYSYSIKSGENVGILSNTFMAVILGGITITNFTKGIIPMLFLKDNFSRIAKKIIIVGFIFGVIIVFLRFYYADEFTLVLAVKKGFGWHVVDGLDASKFFKVIDLFFVAPILFLGVINETLEMNVGGEPVYFSVINMDFCRYWQQYLFGIFIFALAIAGMIRNYRKQLMWMLVLLFLVDLVIHVIVGYGLRDPFIYGGHWVFVIPLLMGWLYKSLTEKYRKLMLVLICILFVGLLINNLVRLYQFVNLAMGMFPVE